MRRGQGAVRGQAGEDCVRFGQYEAHYRAKGEEMSLVLPSEGGCQCGEIRYRLIGEPIFLGVCHCTDCKHQSGSAFGMSLRMRKADVELLQGAPKQWTTRSDNGNPKICVFCGTCGTRLWHGPGPLGNLSVKPGTLDDPSQLAPRYEGWTKRKLPWLRIEGLEASFEEQGSSRRPASAS